MNPLISATHVPHRFHLQGGHPLVPVSMLHSPFNAAVLRQRGVDYVEKEMLAALCREHHQLMGSPLEVVMELAGRTCYDSLGVGRPTEAFFKHLLDVDHLSVLEHAQFVVSWADMTHCEMTPTEYRALLSAVGVRPGMQYCDGLLRFNMRHLAEWFCPEFVPCDRAVHGLINGLGFQLLSLVEPHCPMLVRIIRERGLPTFHPSPWSLSLVSTTEDVDDLCVWRPITLFITCSRGVTHELVRHRNMAFSQRSTRYCDEDATPWVPHPLFEAALTAAQETEDHKAFMFLSTTADETIHRSQACYKAIMPLLEGAAIRFGSDKGTARKQARGAVRGFLGNALYTEIMVTAPLSQWYYFLSRRAHPAADGEMQDLAKCVQSALNVAVPVTGGEVATRGVPLLRMG